MGVDRRGNQPPLGAPKFSFKKSFLQIVEMSAHPRVSKVQVRAGGNRHQRPWAQPFSPHRPTHPASLPRDLESPSTPARLSDIPSVSLQSLACLCPWMRFTIHPAATPALSGARYMGPSCPPSSPPLTLLGPGPIPHLWEPKHPAFSWRKEN